MAQYYPSVTSYVFVARKNLQDFVAPYRYTDDDIVGALTQAMGEIARVRPDVLLDLKYQRPIRKGDIDDGMPTPYSIADIGYGLDGVTLDLTKGTLVPIPTKYTVAVNWFIYGILQFRDVTDTQDQRAQAFLAKFQAHLVTLSAA